MILIRGEEKLPPDSHLFNSFFNPRNSMPKKKAKAPEAPEMITINLQNVFPYIVKTLEALNRKVDRLQLTVDAVGMAVVERKKNG